MSVYVVFIGVCVVSFVAGFGCGVAVTLLRLEGKR